mmetsp:Transcript_25504/g.85360  ORF Transcript_25504/g.85360 Transcript_25504/m.85360 type:complete len:228 (+) Transcript_25504:791-1474(+)
MGCLPMPLIGAECLERLLRLDPASPSLPRQPHQMAAMRPSTSVWAALPSTACFSTSAPQLLPRTLSQPAAPLPPRRAHLRAARCQAARLQVGWHHGSSVLVPLPVARLRALGCKARCPYRSCRLCPGAAPCRRPRPPRRSSPRPPPGLPPWRGAAAPASGEARARPSREDPSGRPRLANGSRWVRQHPGRGPAGPPAAAASVSPLAGLEALRPRPRRARPRRGRFRR